jgi:hypothetical protein
MVAQGKAAQQPQPWVNDPIRALTEMMQRFAARIFDFWRGFGEGAGLQNPVTEPKRCQKSKRLLSIKPTNTPLQHLWKRSKLVFSSFAPDRGE